MNADLFSNLKHVSSELMISGFPWSLIGKTTIPPFQHHLLAYFATFSRWWYNSPSWKENMKNPLYTHIKMANEVFSTHDNNKVITGCLCFCYHFIPIHGTILR